MLTEYDVYLIELDGSTMCADAIAYFFNNK